jgi:hypothetical protein
MKKIIYLTESDLYKISKRVIVEEQLKEGIFDGISNVFQGLKGVWRGEGYEFFRYMNQLKNLVGDLKKHRTAIDKLQKLKGKVEGSKMSPDKKGEIINEINRLINAFDSYSTQLEKSERHILDRLAGRSSANMDSTLDKGKDKRRSGVIIDPSEKDRFAHLSNKEKRELEQYGYYDEEDYEEIYGYPEMHQSIENTVTVNIGGKNYKISDKTKEPFDRNKYEKDPANISRFKPDKDKRDTPLDGRRQSGKDVVTTTTTKAPTTTTTTTEKPETVKENRVRYRYR